MRKFLALVAMTFAVAAASSASAATTFKGSVGSVTANQGPGLIVNTENYNLFDVTLNQGQTSGPFGLFTIWTPESSVEFFEDTSPKSIFVTFNFTQPGDVSGDPISGKTLGFNLIFTQGGAVTWDAPEIYTFGNGGQLKITLLPTNFNWGVFGTKPGNIYGGVVDARFELISESTAVPEPATWAMMIVGFGLAGTALRRRRAGLAIAA